MDIDAMLKNLIDRFNHIQIEVEYDEDWQKVLTYLHIYPEDGAIDACLFVGESFTEVIETACSLFINPDYPKSKNVAVYREDQFIGGDLKGVPQYIWYEKRLELAKDREKVVNDALESGEVKRLIEYKDFYAIGKFIGERLKNYFRDPQSRSVFEIGRKIEAGMLDYWLERNKPTD